MGQSTFELLPKCRYFAKSCHTASVGINAVVQNVLLLKCKNIRFVLSCVMRLTIELILIRSREPDLANRVNPNCLQGAGTISVKHLATQRSLYIHREAIIKTSVNKLHTCWFFNKAKYFYLKNSLYKSADVKPTLNKNQVHATVCTGACSLYVYTTSCMCSRSCKDC